MVMESVSVIGDAARAAANQSLVAAKCCADKRMGLSVAWSVARSVDCSAGPPSHRGAREVGQLACP